MSVSYWLDCGRSAAPVETDVLIVGAGISGASVAYWLRDSGLRVALVEQKQLAWGASGRNTGFLLTGTSEPYSRVVDQFGRERARTIWELTRENHRLLRERIVGDDPDGLGYRAVGSCVLACSETEERELERSLALLREDGANVTWRSAAATNAAWDSEGFHGALIQRDDAAVDPVRLVARIYERSGAALYEGHEVFGWSHGDDGVVLTTSHGRFKASAVVLATNGYLPQLSSHFREMVYPTRGQVLVTEPMGKRFLDEVVYADFGYEYFRQLDDTRLMLGGWRQDYAASEIGYSDETTAVVQEGLDQFLRRHFPRMGSTRVAYRWSGVMGFSQDALPFIGALPESPQVFYCGGFTGHGLGLAFLVGKLTAELLLEGKRPALFSARRFSHSA